MSSTLTKGTIFRFFGAVIVMELTDLSGMNADGEYDASGASG
jgi:hypothetical protein